MVGKESIEIALRSTTSRLELLCFYYGYWLTQKHLYHDEKP
jgi:hypothetical protein